MDLTPSLQATPWGNAWGLRLFGWGRGRCEDLRCPLWVSAVGNSGAQTDPSRDFLSLTDALPTFDKGCLCDTGVRAKVNSPSVFRTCFSGTKDLGFDSCLEVQFRSGKT